jgi:hypothetical protein
MTDEIASPLLEESSKSDTHERRRSSIIQAVDNKIQAYERSPVPDDRLKGWLSFLGLFISRHTAGTEFAIGPLVSCVCIRVQSLCHHLSYLTSLDSLLPMELLP